MAPPLLPPGGEQDFVVFDDSKWTVRWTAKDNTGAGDYVEGMVFPTLAFPSDHGITATSLAAKAPAAEGGGLRGAARRLAAAIQGA